MLSGLLAALLGTTRVAVREPACVGEKLTSTVQLAPAATLLLEQLSLASTNSLRLGPLVESCPIASNAPPPLAALLIVTVCGELVEPTD